MRRTAALVLAILTLSLSPAHALPPDARTLARRVDGYLAPLLRHDLISGSVLIARGGQVLLARGFGPAEREFGAPNTPDTRFRLGSLSKQFTAAAILLLEQRGALDTGDRLSKYLPDFPRADSITLLQLLTHTSGLANFNTLPDYDRRIIEPMTTAEVVAWFRDQPPLAAPGTRFDYSNSNYVLLAAVLEKVSGKDYATFLREELFAPLGMRDTGVDVHETVLGHRAEGYVDTGREIIRTPYRNLALMNGAGSLVSTVRDLYRWDRALRTDHPLGPAARTRLFTPVQSGYACGWFVEQRFGRRFIGHGGAINGFLSDLQRFVDDDVTVIVLLNDESTFARAVQQALGAIALGEPYRPALIPEGLPVRSESLAAAAGWYRIDERDSLTLAPVDGRLAVRVTGSPMALAAAQDDSTFFVRDLNTLLRLVRGPDGRVTRVVARQGAHGYQALRP